jgi:hypothetical protein
MNRTQQIGAWMLLLALSALALVRWLGQPR